MKKKHAVVGAALSLAFLATERELPKYLLSSEARAKIGGFFGAEYGGAIGTSYYTNAYGTPGGTPYEGNTNGTRDALGNPLPGSASYQYQPPPTQNTGGANTNGTSGHTTGTSTYHDPSVNWNPGYVTGAIAGGAYGSVVGGTIGTAAGSYVGGAVGTLFGPAGTILGYYGGGYVGNAVGVL